MRLYVSILCYSYNAGLPLLGVSLQMKPINKLHIILTDMCRLLCPVMYLPLLSPPTVVISGYDAIYDVTVKQGMAFGGRPVAFRGQQAFKRTGILTSTNPERTWSRFVGSPPWDIL